MPSLVGEAIVLGLFRKVCSEGLELVFSSSGRAAGENDFDDLELPLAVFGFETRWPSGDD
jgi:hypothetical protein